MMFIASVKLNDIQLSGPISHNSSEDSFLFVNRANSYDIYVEIKKDVHGNWYQSGGPSIRFPQDFIDSLGIQIDNFSGS